MSAWHDKVSAIIYGWYPGQAGMQAIADIMVGKINPSGKLPATIEKSFKDSPAYGMIPKGMKVSHTAKNETSFFIPWGRKPAAASGSVSGTKTAFP